MNLRFTRVGLAEGLPAVCFLGLVGIISGEASLRWLALVPLLLWILASAQTARPYLDEAKEEGASAVVAMLRGALAPIHGPVQGPMGLRCRRATQSRCGRRVVDRGVRGPLASSGSPRPPSLPSAPQPANSPR